MQQFSAFPADRRGNIAITFALFLSVLLLLVGLAIDFAVAVHRKWSLDAAQDGAMIFATQIAAQAADAGRSDWAMAGDKAAQAMFASNFPAKTNYQVDSFRTTFTRVGTRVTGTGTYQGSTTTTLLNLFGYDRVNIGGSAEAAVTNGNFIDVHFVIDNSQSMGIGADVASQNIIKAEGDKKMPGAGCAIACHLDDGSPGSVSVDRAHQLGAKLRIDFIRDGVILAIQKLRDAAADSGRTRISVHTFSNTLQTLVSPTSDFAAAIAAARNINLTQENGGGGSFINHALDQLNSKLARGGRGSSSADRLSFVVLLSDGIEDSLRMKKNADGVTYSVDNSSPLTNWVFTYPNAWPVNSYLQAFNTESCMRLKDTTNALSGNHNVLAVKVEYVTGVGLMADPRVKFITNSLAVPVDRAFDACISEPRYKVSAKNVEDLAPAFLNITARIVEKKSIAMTK